MHEVFLPIMVMIFTLVVMLGLVIVFRGWLEARDRLIEGSESSGSGASARPAD